MTTALLGSISLNLSFILYLCVYFPQLAHNKKQKNIKSLSINLHGLLYLGYGFDLLYGFSKHLPWQYQTVSVIGFTCILIQHVQLTRALRLQKTSWGVLFVTLILFSYFFLSMQHQLSEKTTEILGYISRLCFLLYTVPQIIKNKRLQNAHAINPYYIYLSLSLSMLDLISAWCLNWGWPNKLAAPFMISLMCILWSQQHRYTSHIT